MFGPLHVSTGRRSTLLSFRARRQLSSFLSIDRPADGYGYGYGYGYADITDTARATDDTDAATDADNAEDADAADPEAQEH